MNASAERAALVDYRRMLEQLEVALVQEHAALSTRDPVALQRSNEVKRRCTTAIESFEWTHALGGRSSTGDATVDRLLRSCVELNQRNGAMVAALSRVVTQALEALTQATDGSFVYDPSGTRRRIAASARYAGSA